MKVIVASFQCESNCLTSIPPYEYDFEYFKGEDIFKKLVVKEELVNNGFEVVPSIYANALPTGVVPLDLYTKYLRQILDTVKKNVDVDGIFLYVHGSMEVEKIGSGELFLLQEIRRIIGYRCIIALTMDLHANITSSLGNYADIICGYKTAPHVDQKETQLRAVKILIKCLKNNIKPITKVVKIPMIIKGDTMLTRLEPLKSLENKTIKLESQNDIFSVNLFFGHCWIDAVNNCASVVVTALNSTLAQETAKILANEFWQTRKLYKFDIEALDISDSVHEAINGKEKRIFITDSGDNTTAGAEGDRLDILKIFLTNKCAKKVCVAGITNYNIVEKYWEFVDNSQVNLSQLNNIDAKIVSHGEILGWAKEIIGRSLTFNVGNVDFIFTEKRSAFIEKANFDKALVNLLDYQIVVVKLGYLFDELKPFADREIFALTDGNSQVQVEKLGLKNVLRPIYPLDEDFEWQV